MNHLGADGGGITSHRLVRKTYYAVRELLPVAVASTFRKFTLAAGENCNSQTGRWISR